MSPSPHSGPSSSSSGGPWLCERAGRSSIIAAAICGPDEAKRNPGAPAPHYAALHAGYDSPPHQHDQIAARHGAIVAIGAVGRRAEFQAVARPEIVSDVALDEGEPAGQHPDDVRHAVVGGGLTFVE